MQGGGHGAAAAAADRIPESLTASRMDEIHAISDPFHHPVRLSFPHSPAHPRPISNCGLYLARPDLITRTKDLIAMDFGAITVER